MDTLLESKPSEMKAEDEETTPTLETSAPFVQPTLFDHITNVTDSMIDLVESLSTEAEETKEPEDAKVEDNAFTNAEEDGPHTAAKNVTPTAVENKPSTPVKLMDEILYNSSSLVPRYNHSCLTRDDPLKDIWPNSNG